MENSTSAASISLTDCGICHGTTDTPKALICLHTFCLKCLKALVAAKEAETQNIACPICREMTPLSPLEGVESLRGNFFVSELLEKRNPQIGCTGCEKEGCYAVGRCIECSDFLCKKCWESHTEMRVFRTHKVCTMEDIQNGEVEGYGLKASGEVLWFYCKTCGIQHAHANHDYVLILKNDGDEVDLKSAISEQLLPVPSPSRSPVSTLDRRRQDVGIWLLHREFGREGLGQLQRGAGIAVCPNGDIVVADKNAAQVKIYSSDGLFKHSLNSKRAHYSKTTTKKAKAVSLPSSTSPGKRQETHDVPSSPHNVVVTAAGEFFITDLSPFVKVFDAQGLYKYHFPAFSTQAQKSDSSEIPLEGLAIDGEGNIRIGANGNTDWYISKHKQDGTHIESANVRIRPTYLSTLLDGKIVVSSHKGVQILDRAGQLLHTLHAPPGVTLWNTAGVCCTKGIVFVANYLGDCMAVYCFLVTGKYLGCATREVRSPKGLAITNDGKKLLLVDTNGKSVKVFTLMQGNS